MSHFWVRLSFFFQSLSLRGRYFSFRVSPLTAWSVCFCLGAAAGQLWRLAPGLLVCLTSLSALAGWAALRRPGPSTAAVFCAALLAGMLRATISQGVAPHDVRRAGYNAKGAVVLTGRVVSAPQVSGRSFSFVFKLEAYHKGEEEGRLSGLVWARVWQKAPCQFGDRLTLRGRLSLASGYMKRALERRGISLILNVSSKDAIRRHPRPRSPLEGFSPPAIRRAAERIFAEYSEPLSAGLLDAMILGEARRVPRSVRDSMIRTGTWHIMVVSGSHTALLAFVFLLVFKIFRLPRRPRFFLTAICIVVYCLVTGASTPVVRATIMTLAVLASYVLERYPVVYHALALAALVIVALDPTALSQVGFQLSFASVLFIVWLYPKINTDAMWDSLGWGQTWLGRAARYLASSLAVSFCAWVGTAPILAYHFRTISWVTVPANIFVVPVAMASVSAGFLVLLAGVAAPPLAIYFASACDILMYLLAKVNAVFAAIPWGYMKIPS